jgi:hypothetical protein
MATTTKREARRNIKLDGETYQVKASYSEEEAIAAAKVQRNARIERAERKAEAEAPASAATSGMIETPAATPAPVKAPKGEWTLLAAFQAGLARNVEPGSRRSRFIASLATGEARALVASIVAAADDGDFAKALGALHNALNGHYDRTK